MTKSKESAEAPAKKSFSIKVLGVGGAGCNAVGHMARELCDGVEFIALNTDASALAQSPVERTLVIGQELTRGMGAGGDPERGRNAAEEDVAKIREICAGADVVFIAAGMGGGTGTGASPVVARVAREVGALVLATVMLPFEWEGGRRQRQAQLGLHELKGAVDGVICLPNQKLFKLIDEKTSMVETFAITHELLAQGVRGIWRLLMRPGLINVDFADLCSVTRGRHAESSLATAEARGEHRAREVVEKLMAHPLLDGGQVLAESAAVLVSIVGGPELTMAEVKRVMEQINRHCENAHIIMGAAIEPDFGDRLSVTVVASSKPAAERSEAEGAPGAVELDTQFVNPTAGSRPASRFVAPPPSATQETTERLLQNAGGRARKKTAKMKQEQLNLEIVSKGRFEKSEPTLHQGQDLDVPTYIRRGVALN